LILFVGAISDRYAIATRNKLRVQLAPQQLLNFNEKTSGGSCNGGSDLKAYEFMHIYGLVDDTCAPFMGLNWLHGFEVAAMTDVDDVRNHQCYICNWDGTCSFLPQNQVHFYSVEEYGTVKGVFEMKAEIYQRGPISCSLNSEAPEFDRYKGGIISCAESNHPQCKVKFTDHVIVIAGWGVDKVSGMEYWIGRNSYGSQWGEGAGGGWFRLRMGFDELGIESHSCKWATPALNDVQMALKQFDDAL
jgi:cathepsin X